jgi:dUTPase
VPFESLPSGYTIGYPQYAIKKGDKIGQLILKRHEGYLLPAEYTKDEARTGGFGSTGE